MTKINQKTIDDKRQHPTNRILAALSESEYERISKHLRYIDLEEGDILYDCNDYIDLVYFPHHGMISVVSIMENGATTEIGLVGKEGIVGIPIILGGKQSFNRHVVQISGSAMKLNAEIFNDEFQRNTELYQLLLLYTQSFLTQVSQTAACNRQHHIENRLARWLLSVQDCIDSDDLPLTQELISYMLGVRRSGVSIAAQALQESGIISYTRGHIKILDQKALEKTACECYSTVKQEYFRLFNQKITKF